MKTSWAFCDVKQLSDFDLRRLAAYFDERLSTVVHNVALYERIRREYYKAEIELKRRGLL